MTDKKNLTVDQKTIERLTAYQEAMTKQITRQNKWKSENRVQISLVVTPETKARWKAAAEANGMKLHGYIVQKMNEITAETNTEKENKNHDSNNTITGQTDTQSSAQNV